MTWAPIVEADVQAALLERGVPGAQGDLGDLISASQSVVATVLAGVGADSYSLDWSLREELRRAAQVMISVARGTSGARPEGWTSLTVLASLHMALSGDLSSARLVARDLSPDLIDPILCGSLGVALIDGSFTPQLPDQLQKAVSRTEDHLRRGNGEGLDQVALSLAELAARIGSPLRVLSLALAQACVVEAKRRSSVLTLSRHIRAGARGVIDALVEERVLTLTPHQVHAIDEREILSSSEDSLAALPTGTGKTLLGILALADCLADGPGLGVYVAPYVSLAHQVQRELARFLPSGYRVTSCVGRIEDFPELQPSYRREVLVATPERLDILLRRSDILSSLKAVVADECQLLESETRGPHLELLLSRLRMRQKKDWEGRLLLLAPPVETAESVQGWLGVDDDKVASAGWRPCPLRLSVLSETGDLHWLIGETDTGAPQVGSLVEQSLSMPLSRTETEVVEEGCRLAEELMNRLGGPILCLATSKRRTQKLAIGLSLLLSERDSVGPNVREALRLIELRYPFLSKLGVCLRSGTAWHNATLPIPLRLAIEDAIREGELQVVSSTTTLAEGIDLPFRATLVLDWHWYSGRAIGSHLIWNVAGRCGRPGMHLQGDVVVVANPSRAPRDDALRKKEFSKVLEKPNEVRSALSEEGALSSVQNHAILSSHLLAAISENPEEAGLEDAMSSAMMPLPTPLRRERKRVILEQLDSFVADKGGQLAVRSSPLRLTDVGNAIRLTGLSAQTGRRLASLLSDWGKERECAECIAKLMVSLHDVPEQKDRKWSKVVAGQGTHLLVSLTSLPGLLSTLLNDGESRTRRTLAELFAELPETVSQGRRVTAAAWAEGEVDDWWDKRFEYFSSFVEGVILGFAPWVTGAAKRIDAALTSRSGVNWRDHEASILEVAGRVDA